MFGGEGPLAVMSVSVLLRGLGAASVAAACLAVCAAPAPQPVTPPRILQTAPIAFPNTLGTLDLTSGRAAVEISVDDQGALDDLLVLSYTEPAFAEAAVGALRRWRYEPATVAGHPVGACLRVDFDFRADGKVLLTNATSSANRYVDQVFGPPVTRLVCPPDDLDHPLRVRSAVAPVNPAAGAAGPARVVVAFYVDSSGRARLPVVMSSNGPRYAAAAVAALERWRFVPPTSGGRPVAVQVQEEFIFDART
jgi:TonB family protein